MYKVKIVSSISIPELEEYINTFLEQNDKEISKVLSIDIKKIGASTEFGRADADYILMATITYKTNNFQYNEEQNLFKDIKNAVNLAKSVREKLPELKPSVTT